MRLRAALAVAVLAGLLMLAACGGESTPAPATGPAPAAATASDPPTALAGLTAKVETKPPPIPRLRAGQTATTGDRHFVGLPIVQRSSGQYAHVEVTARVDRGLPQGEHSVQAYFDVTGTTGDLPGIQHVDGVLGCYTQLMDIVGHPRVGRLVQVRLTVGRGAARQVLSASVRVERFPPADPTSQEYTVPTDRFVLKRLGCRAAPPRHVCSRRDPQSEIVLASVSGGATCALGRRVMDRVETWIDDSACDADLCAHDHRMNLGYRCTVAKVGEADWTIVCKRGGRIVRGYVSS
jgi:hypothetical protein